MPTLSHVAFVALLVTAAVHAQTLTVPTSYASSPAPSSTAYPFGYSGPIRVQVLHAASETGTATPVVLRGLEVRGNPTSTNAAKSNIDLAISLSTSPLVRTTMTNTFATNHGPNLTTVYTRKLSSVAATQPSFLGQGSGMLMFDVPFVYDPAAGSLLVDFDVAAQPTGGWTIESAASGFTSGRHSVIGASCGTINLTSSGGGNSRTLTYTLTSGPAGAPAAFLIGTLALPAALPIPGSPGCNLYQDVQLVLPVTLNASGGYSLPIGYSGDPALRGFTLFAQVGALDTTAAALRATHSQAVTLTEAHDGGRLYTLGNNTSPTGTLQLGSMIVIRFLR